MKLESVRALRLIQPAHAAGRAPIPPLGLRGFDQTARDLAIVLDLDPRDRERAQLDAAAAQIPLAREIEPGRIAIVLPERAAPAGLLKRLFGGARDPIPRAVRATALLARGYSHVEATVDPKSGLDLVWGIA